MDISASRNALRQAIACSSCPPQPATRRWQSLAHAEPLVWAGPACKPAAAMWRPRPPEEQEVRVPVQQAVPALPQHQTWHALLRVRRHAACQLQNTHGRANAWLAAAQPYWVPVRTIELPTHACHSMPGCQRQSIRAVPCTTCSPGAASDPYAGPVAGMCSRFTSQPLHQFTPRG